MTHCSTYFRALFLVAFTLGGLAALPPGSLADDPQPPETRRARDSGPPRGGARSGAKSGELKKYAEIITSNAKTTPGLFTVHRIDDKLYFEIPSDAYGKLMLWTTEVAKAPAGVGWGGSALGNRVVRWERRGNKVQLWQVSFEKRADGKAIQQAVESATMASIVMTFDVEAEGRDRAPVINVTPLFTTDVPEFSARNLVGGAASVDSSRSYLEEVKAFPTNIETRSLLTFRMSSGGAGGGRGDLPSRRGTGDLSSVSVLIHYSLTLLPDKPMQGRYFDPRVGYFTRSFEDYADKKNWVVKHQYIARFRLEKKNPKAAVSDPVKPITFYISREVPEKWRSHIKQGVEDWKPAFEKAGFSNAIVCKEAPSAEDDPSWDPEDARYSVIRWVALPTMNAMGPHVHDPRSGEIVSAHIIMWHDVLKLVQQWYFVQCAALDPQARKLPFADELTGKLLRFVVTHEVGHTLGLRHNHRASSAYTISQLRDPKFTAAHGTTASIMSYGRFNYVAQPEDKVTALCPRIGPYDLFAIEWGYKPIPDAKSPEDERADLDKWAAKQMTEPWLRFGGEDGPAMVDPTVKTENIGADSLQATALGLKNLDRVVDLLVPATTTLGEDESLLKETYQTILTHRANWFRAVAMMVGGVAETRSLGHGSESFHRVPKEKQQEAVRFLVEHAFTTPRKLLQPALVNRFKYFGVADEVMSQQRSLLDNLLSGRRFRLLMDEEIVAPDQAYTALQFLLDVQDGVWSEAKGSAPVVDVCRRSLQRAYLERLKNELHPKEAATTRPIFPDGDEGRLFTADNRGTDFRAVARAALRDLDERLAAALPNAKDAMTRVHFQDCRREIDLILNPKN